MITAISLLWCCNSQSEAPVPAEPDPAEQEETFVSLVDSSVFSIGIPLYTGDQGKEFWTELNTQMRPYRTEQAVSAFQRQFLNGNPYLECLSEMGAGAFGVKMTFFKTFFDDRMLPPDISGRVTGLRFNALGYGNDSLNVRVLDIRANVLAEENFELDARRVKTYTLHFDPVRAKEVIFSLTTSGSDDSTRFGIDDVYLKTRDPAPFSPPESDAEFITWLKRASFNFFDWNYEQVAVNRGVVLESYTDADKVSLSGIGYAYPIFIIAAEEGYISAEEARARITAMLNWQLDQNWYDGSGGWHGFPHHYFNKDGSGLSPDVSTIDWAICAAGLRVVKQYYAGDAEIVRKTETLLDRPDWTAALAEEDKIAMGFNGYTGEMNEYRWALAFSEETELIYLEAVASGDLESGIFETIVRERKAGFYPSWFGAGFTYNWLQLWTGSMEPYHSNSVAAYQVDAATSLKAFDRPLMGLTACATVKDIRPNGFVNWSQYISNQGGSVHGARLGEVIQVSPAPYGAALALPFIRDKALTALRAFAEMGDYHEYLGLPDNVRMKALDDSITPVPNWNPYDINIGPVIMAIEQIQTNRVGSLYLSDNAITAALDQLVASFGP